METKIQQHYNVTVQYADGSGEVFKDCMLPLVTREMADTPALTLTKNNDGKIIVINFSQIRKFSYIYEEPSESASEE